MKTTPTTPAPPPSIDRWVEWKAFQRAHSGIFPTPASMQWFIRANKLKLRSRGLLLKLGNRTCVDAPGMAVLIEDLAQQSRDEAAAALAEAA